MAAITRYLAWSVTLASVAIFAIMSAVTLPHLTQMAGQEPFDLLWRGYGFDTARQIVKNLDGAGAAYYESVQHRLDNAFPVLNCLALIYWQSAFARRWREQGLVLPTPVLASVLSVSVIGNAADLGENAFVSAMLAAGGTGLSWSMVDWASWFTVAKFFFDALAYASVAVLAAGPFAARFMRRGN